MSNNNNNQISYKFFSDEVYSKYKSLVNNIKRDYSDVIPDTLLNINIFNPDVNHNVSLTPKDYIDLSTEQFKITNNINKLNLLNSELDSLYKLLDHARKRQINIDNLNELISSFDIDYGSASTTYHAMKTTSINTYGSDLTIEIIQIPDRNNVAIYIKGTIPKQFSGLKSFDNHFYSIEEMISLITSLDFKYINLEVK